MELIGYKLIRLSDNAVVESWGGIRGQISSHPPAIFLPNNIQVFCPVIDEEYFGHKLVNWYYEPPVEPVPEENTEPDPEATP
jgi:hypothetical protein